VDLFQGAILGLIQGLTEFLPISSNAHLRVSAELLGWQDPGAAFTAVTQIGTESAVLIYFRKDIARILRAWSLSLVRKEMRADHNARLGWFVLLGTLPIAILGLTFQNAIEGPLRDLRVVASALIIFSLVLAWSDRRPANVRTIDSLTTKDALVLGLWQALALIPGVSRSGGTIAGGLFRGLTREAAARYSFLLAIPAVLSSAALELTKIGEGAQAPWLPTLLATAIAFVVGYAVIAWLLRYVVQHSFAIFIRYRLIIGALIFGLLAMGVISP
jgi:undecaprenyl-diphosphatase